MSENSTDNRLAAIEKLLEREAKHSDNNLAFGAGLAAIVFSPNAPAILSPVVECASIRANVAVIIFIAGLAAVVYTWIRHGKISRA